MHQHITIIGAGSFGTALALILSGKTTVSLWTRRAELAQHINTTRTNTYLPDVKLPASVSATSSLEDCLRGSTLVIFAVPSLYMRETLRKAAPFITMDMSLLHVVKGLEEGTGKLMSEVIKEEVPFDIPLAVLAGPNHAEEIVKGLPTATVIASSHKKTRESLCTLFSTPSFKTYPHDDVIGIEVCGAVKNIIAIAIGVCDGLRSGDNAKGSILTLGLAEMNGIARAFGAKRATCFGLAGVGDLIATCFSAHSRNRFVGEMMAKGKNLDQIRGEMHGMVAEGIRTSRTLHELCTRKSISAPLTTQTYRVLYENVNLRDAINDLLSMV